MDNFYNEDTDKVNKQQYTYEYLCLFVVFSLEDIEQIISVNIYNMINIIIDLVWFPLYFNFFKLCSVRSLLRLKVLFFVYTVPKKDDRKS